MLVIEDVDDQNLELISDYARVVHFDLRSQYLLDSVA